LLKYVLIIGAIILIIAALAVGFFKWSGTSNPDYVRKLLQKETVRSSIVFKENAETKINMDSSEMMGLASTVKLMVAMEYAFQFGEGKIDSQERINLQELNKYYIPNLDGGAHEAWLNDADKKNLIENDTVPIREAARGMMAFSSNANTEFLLDRLEIEQIEKRMKAIGIKEHSPLHYFTSSIFIPYEIKLREYQDTSMNDAKKDIIKHINNMDDKEWAALSSDIHEKLASNAQYKEKANVLDWWNEDYDRIQSERFIKSTASEYADFMSKVNNKQFPEKVQAELEYLLGSLMDNPANQEWLERAGKKGGSTMYIITDALFAEDKQGNKFELAIFFNELEWYQSRKLMASLNEFELKLLNDPSIRDDMYELLN